MKKLILQVFALSVLLGGCYFGDSSKKNYSENIVSVNDSKTYSFSADLQEKDAYLVCYNAATATEKSVGYSATVKNSSKDSFSWEESEYSSLYVSANSSRSAGAAETNHTPKIDFDVPKRVDYIPEPVDLKLIPCSGARWSSSSKNLPDYTGDEANFYLDEKYNNEKVTATKMKEGEYCRVWYYKDSSVPSPSDSVFEDLADRFDKIYPIETTLLCSNVPTRSYNNIIDVTESTKINILVYDIFDDYEETKEANGGTYGFFAPNDMYTDSNYSNKCEMFYVDTYFLTTKDSDRKEVSPGIVSTLVHEFQHMLGFVQKGLNYNLSGMMGSTWYTEMLSMLTEEFFVDFLRIDELSGPQGRLSTFLSGTVQGFSIWSSDDSVYYKYANAYAFGAYLARNFGGIDLIQQIFRNKYLDDESVARALAYNGYDYSFSELLALFSAAQIFVADSSHISLYKSGSKTVGGGNLTYPKIDLSDFYSILYSADKKSDFEKILSYIYEAQGINSHGSFTTDDGEEYLKYTGPIYYKKNPSCYVNPTGSYIVHLGNIKEFTMSNNSGLKYYILFK